MTEIITVISHPGNETLVRVNVIETQDDGTGKLNSSNALYPGVSVDYHLEDDDIITIESIPNDSGSSAAMVPIDEECEANEE